MHADLISHYSGLVILHKITKFSPPPPKKKKKKDKNIMRMDKVKCGKNNFSCIFTCTHNFDFILCSLSLQNDRICHMKLCVLSIQVELSHILPLSHFFCPVCKVKFFKGISFIVLSTF